MIPPMGGLAVSISTLESGGIVSNPERAFFWAMLGSKTAVRLYGAHFQNRNLPFLVGSNKPEACQREMA